MKASTEKEYGIKVCGVSIRLDYFMPLYHKLDKPETKRQA